MPNVIDILKFLDFLFLVVHQIFVIELVDNECVLQITHINAA